MVRYRVISYLLCFALLFVVVGGLVGEQVLAIQESSSHSFVLPPNQEEPDEEEPVEGPVFEDVINLKVDYPILSAESGSIVEFDVELLWMGGERRRFDLVIIPPAGWKAVILTQYGRFPEAQIAAMELEPRRFFGNKVKIIGESLPGNRPDPGDYVFKFEASSEDIRGTVDLIVRITAKYEFAMVTETLRLSTEATAGEDNHLSIILINSGSAPIENLALTSTKPEGWIIIYNPEKIDSLAPGLTQMVDVVIMPPKKTIAGDWPITLWARSSQVADELAIRVTVLTPTIWGWIGILIVIAVIVGVGVVFWRLGRR